MPVRKLDCMSVYLRVYVRTRVRVCVACMYVCMYACVRACVCVCERECVCLPVSVSLSYFCSKIMPEMHFVYCDSDVLLIVLSLTVWLTPILHTQTNSRTH